MKTKPKAAPVAELSQFQKFEPRRIHRRDIKNAAYNPRIIDRWAKKKLQDWLKKRGLMNALVWNEKTGNLVSGHQRLAIVDQLEATDNYLLDVDVVRLSPKQEREANVYFNNKNLQGDWDLGKLAEMFQDDGASPEAFGFGRVEVDAMFAGSDWEGMFSEAGQDAGVQEAMQAFKGTAETRRETNAAKTPKVAASATAEDDELADVGDDAPDGDDAAGDGDEAYAGAPVAADAEAPHGRLVNGAAIRDPEAHAKIKAEREKARARMKDRGDDDTSDFFAIVVCGNAEERSALMRHFGTNPKSQYLEGPKVFHQLGIPMPKTERA